MYIGGNGVAYCFWEGRPPCRPLPMRQRLTGLSAPKDIPDCHVISKVPVVDTEVDPPRQISPVSHDKPYFISSLTRIFTRLRLHLPHLHAAPPALMGYFDSACG